MILGLAVDAEPHLHHRSRLFDEQGSASSVSQYGRELSGEKMSTCRSTTRRWRSTPGGPASPHHQAADPCPVAGPGMGLRIGELGDPEPVHQASRVGRSGSSATYWVIAEVVPCAAPRSPSSRTSPSTGYRALGPHYAVVPTPCPPHRRGSTPCRPAGSRASAPGLGPPSPKTDRWWLSSWWQARTAALRRAAHF